MPAIALRTFGADNNPAGASPFIGIPVPVGVRDGDVLIVGLSTPTGVTITPPSDEWTLVAATDPNAPIAISVYWATALNVGNHWIFALSSSVQAAGGCLVYGGLDPFEPVELFASVTTATAAADVHAIAGYSTSFAGDEIALFIGAPTAGTYAPATGYLRAVAHTQVNATLEAHHKSQPQAAAVAPTSSVFSPSAAGNYAGASIVLALRPGVGKLSLEEVKERLVEAFPAGADRVYDLDPGGDYYLFFLAIAQILKVYGFDLVDLLRLEISPATCRYKLPQWERIFGLETSRTAIGGTIPQRQAQVVAAWRAAAGQGSTIPTVQAVVGPLLGYADPSQLVILEVDRTALDLALTYEWDTPLSIVAGGSAGGTVIVRDASTVSPAGARLVFDNPIISDTGDLLVQLTGPDAFLKAWELRVDFDHNVDPMTLYAREFSGRQIYGAWTVSIISSAGNFSADDFKLLVEGGGREDGQDGFGTEIFHWGVFVDRALANVVTPEDDAGALFAIRKIQQAHTYGTLIKPSALASPTSNFAIPDDPNAIPDRCIPA